ncbi:MAG TPA: RNA polymerase sigma factor [Bryobacteraceae bacterium]|nr:RNA polymerase sigma factor [Bryobacteraceae bacterium]
MSELPIERSSEGQLKAGDPNLERLMAGYQQADRASAELLMESLSPMLTRFFMSTTDGRQNCADLVQETLLRIHRARHSYRAPDPVLPWVFAIARHVRVDQFRKRRRTEMHEQAVEPEVLARQETASVSGGENLPDFDSLVSALPESQKQVVTMLKVFGMSVEEVARATSSSVGSVKQKAHRAYDRLREILQNPGSPEKVARR